MNSAHTGPFTGKLVTASNEAWHRPQSPSSRQDDELMNTSSRALSHTSDPVERLRLLCLSTGANGILGLGRVFRRLGEEGCKSLNKQQFVKGLKDTGLDINDEEGQELFDKFTDGKGSINVDEFINMIRPPMSETRRHIVEQAFRKLNKSGSGTISLNDLRSLYQVKAHPRYMSGEDTEDTILTKFLANFEKEGDGPDGTVTLEEFMNYYSGISVTIDNDCYFDLLMRQTYKL